MSDWSDDNHDIQHPRRYAPRNNNEQENDGEDDAQSRTWLGRAWNVVTSFTTWATNPSHLKPTVPQYTEPIVDLPDSGSHDQAERQKRMKELENQIAEQKAETEAILAKRKAQNEKGKAEMERQTTERQLKIKEEDEKHQQLLQQQENERKAKAAEAEQRHQQKLKEIEEERLKNIAAMEAEMEIIQRKKEERQAKAEKDKIKFKEQSEARMAEILRQKTELENEIEKMKQESQEKSKEWEESFEAKLKTVQDEYQKEIDNRRVHEETQIQTIKRINEEDEQKLKALTKSLGELHNVVAEKAQEMRDYKPKLEPSNEQNIKVVENELIGSSEIIVQDCEQQSIGIIGLPKTGRSFLIGALAGGIWPNDLGAENPIKTKNGIFYKLNHPNNGFVNGSINENRPIYQQFFQNSNLSKLSMLILTIDGAIREEDYLILLIAKEYSIPTVIVRTKLDEWLDNLPKGQTKEEYVENDKKFVLNSLKELNFPFLKNHIFNVSALALISVIEDGPESDMARYQQDGRKLIEELHFGNKHSNIKISNSPTVVDILILGLKSAGKSHILNALQKQTYFNEKKIYEISYDEMDDLEGLIKMVLNYDAKIYFIVIGNTVGRVDAKIISYLLKEHKAGVALLNKSDEIIDNLKKQGTFISTESYIEQRHNAANIDLSKVGASDIPLFTVSALRLDGQIDENYSTEEEKLLEYLKQFF